MILQFKNYIIAFWIAIFYAIAPYFLSGNPCALCIIHRFLFTITALLIFISKFLYMWPVWLSFFRKIIFFNLMIAISALIYHLLISLKFLKGPSFCELNTSFFKQILNSCQDGNPFLIISGIFANLIIFYLIFKAK